MKLAKKTYIDPQRLPRLQGATLRRILGYTKPYRLRAASVIACMIGAAILNLAPAWFVKQIVDVAIPRGQTTYLWLCCAAMVVGRLIAAATAGKALVDDDCAKKAVAELTRE